MSISKSNQGDKDYMEYVGPAAQYDFLGAAQFRLLTTLGLRANHNLLDFGCGSLRAGRLFIGYLNEGRYFGIEPNKWLIEDAIYNQIGRDVISLKKPRFDHNRDFVTDVFALQFDFILAQSIFSHCDSTLIIRALQNFKNSLKRDGIIAATFVEGDVDFQGNGWVYPGSVSYRPSTIKRFAQKADLSICRIPWYHPRQTWYLLSMDRNRLPNNAMMRYLYGVVLFDPEFINSWRRHRAKRSIKRFLRKTLPQPIINGLKGLLAFGRKNR